MHKNRILCMIFPDKINRFHAVTQQRSYTVTLGKSKWRVSSLNYIYYILYYNIIYNIYNYVRLFCNCANAKVTASLRCCVAA